MSIDRDEVVAGMRELLRRLETEEATADELELVDRLCDFHAGWKAGRRTSLTELPAGCDGADQPRQPLVVSLTEVEAEDLLLGIWLRTSVVCSGTASLSAELGQHLALLFEARWGWPPGIWSRITMRPLLVKITEMR